MAFKHIYQMILHTSMKQITILTIVFCITACSTKNKENQKNKILSHTKIGLKDGFIGNGGFLLICKNKVIGFEESALLPAFYRVEKDKNNFNLSRFVNRGQGPDEVLRPFNIQYQNEDTIGVYDIMNMSYYSIPITSNNDSIEIRKHINFNKRYFRVIKTAYRQYLALSNEDNLFELLNSDAQIIKTSFQYPYKNENEKTLQNSIRSIAYQGTLATNPNATRCVFAPFSGEIIQFYKIKKEDIELVNKIERDYPQYDIENGNAIINANTNEGYLSIATTEKFVYALFNGCPIKESLESNESMEGQILRVFDWNGNEIKEFDLDIPCKHIGISHDDKILWAVAKAPDISLVYFNLNGNSDTILRNETPALNNIEKEPSGNEDKNPSLSEIRKIELKNIYRLKTDSLFGIYENLSAPIISVESTTNEIKTKIKYTNNTPIIHFWVTKESLGKFSDTVTVNLENGEKIKTIYFGSVK